MTRKRRWRGGERSHLRFRTRGRPARSRRARAGPQSDGSSSRSPATAGGSPRAAASGCAPSRPRIAACAQHTSTCAHEQFKLKLKLKLITSPQSYVIILYSRESPCQVCTFARRRELSRCRRRFSCISFRIFTSRTHMIQLTAITPAAHFLRRYSRYARLTRRPRNQAAIRVAACPRPSGAK